MSAELLALSADRIGFGLPVVAIAGLFAFERESAVLGLVGAGGIGQELVVAIRKFYYSDVSAILLTIVVTVFLIDIITNGRKHQAGDPGSVDMPAKGGNPALTAGQKAAAVNLGIFPDSSGGSYALASTTTPDNRRLSGNEEVARPQQPVESAPVAQVTPSWTGQASKQLASASLPQRVPPIVSPPQ